MKKYKVIKAFYKLSEQKNYVIDDEIELSDEDAKSMNWYVVGNKEPYSESEEGTKGIVYRKTPEEADKEIKKVNKKIKN